MKRLSYILLAAMLVAALAVSCTAEVIDDSLVAMVRFTENSGARALEVSREDISVGTLYWKYDAVKVSGPASGAVTGKYLGQGLSNEAGPFSLGDWNFTLYGYKDKECKTLMYKGTGTGTVEKGKTNAIRISVEPQMTQEGTGSLHISKSIQLTKDGVVVKGSDGSTTYTATSVVVTRLSDGSEVNVNADDSYFWKADGITSGSYKVVVAFVDNSTGIIHAENTAYVNVFDGLTTVIKGTLDEVTSSISFDANFTEGRISETKTVSPDTDGNVSASFGFSPVSNESSTGNDVLGTTIEGSFTGSGSIELNVYGSEGASSRFSAEDENSIASAGFDINLSEGLTVAENGNVTITTYIQPGLTGKVKVVYRDEEGNVPEEGQPTVVSYEVETGKLRFTTTHFSEYYVVSDSVAENTTSGKRYATLQDAVDYARDGEEIKLLKNVDTVESLVFSNGTKLILDLNGHTVKNIVELDPRPRYFTVVSIDNESSVTLKNGTIQAMDNDCYAINVIDGKLVIESGKYIGNISVVQVQKGTLEILRGEFSLIQTWPTPNDSTGCLYTINCIDANYNGGSAIVSIKGGTFRMFNPQDCYAEGAHTNFVAAGYISVRSEDENSYTVRKLAEGEKAVADYETLKEAVKEDGTIIITNDITLAETIEIKDGKTVEINLNGKTVSIVDNYFSLEGANVSVSGNGRLVRTGSSTNALFWLYGSTEPVSDYTVLSIGKDVVLEAPYAIAVNKNSASEEGKSCGIVVNLNGTINASVCGVYTNGTCNSMDENAPVFNMDGANITASNSGIYAAGYAVWNIKDTTIESANALSLKSGSFTIDGGSFRSTGEYSEPAEDTSNGSVDTGAALSMTSNDGYAKKLDVVVNSGRFESVNGYAVYEGIPNKKNSSTPVAAESYVNLVINGGEFIGNTDKGSIKLNSIKNPGVVHGGTFNVAPDASYYAEGYLSE